jgi:hypothetical protein
VGGTVILNHTGRRYKATVDNVSMGGLCTSLHQTLPLGATLTLDIPLAGGEVAVVHAEVVRSYIGGAAMRFHWSGEGDHSRLLLQEVLDG